MLDPAYFSGVIRDANLGISIALKAAEGAQRELESRRSQAVTSLTTAISAYPFSYPDITAAAELIVPTLFMAHHATIPIDLDLLQILTTLNYNLSIARDVADPLQVPFYLRIEHQTPGLTKRGGPLPGESFERENDETTVMLGYLRTLSLRSHAKGEFPSVHLEVHRCIVANMNLENLTAPARDAAVGEERTGVISLAGYKTKYPPFFALFGPHLSTCLSQHLGSGTGVQLLVGADLVKTGFPALPHSEIVTAMADGVGMTHSNPA